MGEEVAANGKAQGQAWDGAQFRNITNHGSQHRKGFSGLCGKLEEYSLMDTVLAFMELSVYWKKRDKQS